MASSTINKILHSIDPSLAPNNKNSNTYNQYQTHSQPMNTFNQHSQGQPQNTFNQHYQTQPMSTFNQGHHVQPHTPTPPNYFPPQTLAISKTKAVKKGKALTTSTSEQPLYILATHTSKPTLRFYRPNDTTTHFASATLHSLTSRIDLSLPSGTFALTRPDMLSTTYVFMHARFGTLKWKPKSSSLLSNKLELVDGQGTVLARYETHLASAKWYQDTKGFEMLVGMDGELLDLVVVTGWAVVEYNAMEEKAIGKAVSGAF